MKVTDPGHAYEVAGIDGGEPQGIVFVKRIGAKFPGNEPPAHGGTQLQELLRVCHDRLGYVNAQTPCAETEAASGLIAAALLLLEMRAHRRHGSALDATDLREVVTAAPCPTCGHVKCWHAAVQRESALLK